jgi:purine nucleosidase
MREHRYTVDRRKQVRVIIDTDCDCEADDQFAVLHHLISRRTHSGCKCKIFRLD